MNSHARSYLPYLVIGAVITGLLPGLTPSLRAQHLKVEITLPETGTEVGATHLVSGTVTSTDLRPHILIHPMSTDLWWVQRRPEAPNRDGSWSTLCYFGTETQGVGDYYQIVAIISSEPMREGQTFRELPDGLARSDLVTVRRTN